MSITADQKQQLAAAWEGFRAPVGKHLFASNTIYFLTAVKSAGITAPDMSVLKAAEFAKSSEHFTALIADAEYREALNKVQAAANAAVARACDNCTTLEQVLAFAAKIDAI
jgi:hypothetical protein